MSGRHRLHNITFGGWLVVASLLAVPVLAQQDTQEPATPVNEGQGVPEKAPIPESDSGESADGEQAPPADAPPTVATAESKPSTEPPCGPRCQDAEKREAADLVAQQRMAESTEDIVTVTQWQLWVGAAGIALLLFTLKLTRDANRAAVRAAKAAESAVKVTEISAERQSRAYIAIGQPIWKTLMAEDLKKINGFSYSILWENCGTTPARRCRSHAYQESFDGRIPDDFDYPDKPVDRVSEKSHIGPKKDYQSIVGVSVADAQAAERGEKHIFVWGWIEYDDIFPGTPRHRTEVCVELIISNGGRNCAPTITGPFNGADEDCHHKPKT